MTSLADVARNAAAVRAVAALLAREGAQSPDVLAEQIADVMAREGWVPLEKPPTPRGPGSTEAGRRAARRLFEQTRPKKERR